MFDGGIFWSPQREQTKEPKPVLLGTAFSRKQGFNRSWRRVDAFVAVTQALQVIQKVSGTVSGVILLTRLIEDGDIGRLGF